MSIPGRFIVHVVFGCRPIPEQHDPPSRSEYRPIRSRPSSRSRHKIAEDQSLIASRPGRDGLQDERRLPAAQAALRPSQQIYAC